MLSWDIMVYTCNLIAYCSDIIVYACDLIAFCRDIIVYTCDLIAYCRDIAVRLSVIKSSHIEFMNYFQMGALHT